MHEAINLDFGAIITLILLAISGGYLYNLKVKRDAAKDLEEQINRSREVLNKGLQGYKEQLETLRANREKLEEALARRRQLYEENVAAIRGHKLSDDNDDSSEG